MPAISDDAAVVAYVETADDDGTIFERVVVRDRTADTTQRAIDPQSTHPGISGNGCVVAYNVLTPADPAAVPPTPAMVGVHAHDRCATGDGTLGPNLLPVDEQIEADMAMAAPALSLDGGRIVWSAGTELRRYDRDPDGTYTRIVAPFFDPLGAAVAAKLLPADAVVAPDVDISSDGNVVAFVAGAAGTPYAPTVPNVYSWSNEDQAQTPVVELLSAEGPVGEPPVPGDEPSTAPTLSGDGKILLYESSNPELTALNGSTPIVPFLVFVDRTAGGTGLLLDDASRPTLSDDGRHVVYERTGAIRAAFWGEVPPFGSFSDEVVFEPSDGAATPNGALVSRHGRSVVFDSDDGLELDPDAVDFHGATHVWLRQRSQSTAADPSPLDLGTVDVPATPTGRTTFTNNGSTGVPITGVTVDAPLTLESETCTAAIVLHPGQSCTIDVQVDLTDAGTVSGAIRVAGGIPASEFTIDVTVTATDPSATTTTVPNVLPTSPVATTLPPPPTTAAPATTAPATTATTVTVPSRPPSTSPPNTTRPTTATTTTTTTTTLPLPAVFDPPAFEFAPTIVDAGRRVAVVNLVNPATTPVTVTGVVLDPAGGHGFVADPSACVGQPLLAGTPCAVMLEFAPTDEGDSSATLVADMSDGTRATATVTGFGAPPPTLTVTPDVASNGQAVAVIGAGFPAGIAVEFSWDEGRVASSPVTDDVGGFVETLVVLPNTVTGPSEVRVDGQVDLFADTTAELLIGGSGSRGNSAFLVGLGPSTAR